MNRKAWVVVIISFVVILIGLVVVLPLVIRQSLDRAIDRALQPISQVDQQISTQISNLMYPTPTVLPNPVTIVREVRGMAKLVTIQYTLEKVITAEVGQGVFEFLVGDKILFVAHGYVQAGIDLEKLDPEDITVKGEVVYIKLPEPEIFVATLDNEKSFVYDRKMGFLSRGNIGLETAARRKAEEEIRKSAIEDGILDLARVNAENYISGLIRALGFSVVVFE